MFKLKFVIVAIVFLLYIHPQRVDAQNRCECVNWDVVQTNCHGVKMCPPPWSSRVCSPAGCDTTSVCAERQCSTTLTCGPGAYVCNRESGCCAIGTVDTGSGGGGGSPPPPTPTPTPLPVNITARAVTLPDLPDTCAEITSSTDYRDGTILNLDRAGTLLGAKTQASDAAYLSWSAQAATFRLVPQVVTGLSTRPCITDTAGSRFGSYSVTMTVPASSAKYDVAYAPFGPWFQVQGGDVYAADYIHSLIPAIVSPRLFNLDLGPSGNTYPGIVTYGSTAVDGYSFDETSSSYGSTLVSTQNWLVNQKNTAQDFYSIYYNKLGSPTTADYASPSAAITQPSSRTEPYYVTGDVTTTGNWTVTDGQTLILLVDGSITIGGEMHTTGTGIIVVVAKDNIYISSSVGGTMASSTPTIEGVYIAGDTFHTGASSVVGAERFVGKGMFIGNALAFERDLRSVSGNQTIAAHLFIYNPSYLFSLPDAMNDTPRSWQEVAP